MLFALFFFIYDIMLRMLICWALMTYNEIIKVKILSIVHEIMTIDQIFHQYRPLVADLGPRV